MTTPPETPLGHVLIPTYGRADLLSDALASTAGFVQHGWPVTVVDDATPDDSVKDLCATFPHVEYVRNPEQLGIARNFNACANLSRGQYTVLAGSDDVFLPAYPTLVTSLIERFGSTELIQPGVMIIDGTGKPALPLADRVKKWLTPKTPTGGKTLCGDRLASTLLLGDWLYFPAIAWRTDVITSHPFSENFTSAMDLDVLLRVIFDGGCLALDRTPGLLYRRHLSSASSVAVHGTRFDEELGLAHAARAHAQELGWKRSAWAAALSPSVRAHQLLATLRH